MSLKINVPGAPRLDVALAAALITGWTACLVAILTHRQFVTNDSISNYAHVWYVADVLWHGGGVPFHFPEIGHGAALAFPYGFLPWFTAAVLRPVLGDWVVTLWLVLGGVAVVAAALWAFPELRAPLPLALFLANPLLVEAVLLGQLPFLWATAPWFLAIGLWRRDHLVWAVVLAAVAQAGHPAVVLPLAGLTVLLRLPFEPRRKRLFWAYTASVLLALPAVVMVLVSPVVEDSSPLSLLGNFVGTTILRAGVVFAPFIVILIQRVLGQRSMRVAVVGVVALNVILVPIRDTGFAWHALARDPDRQLLAFLNSPQFERGQTYRLLRVADGKVGMYQLIQHGGRLDSEFFPESIDRRSWANVAEYQAFLRDRKVDHVIIYADYTRRYKTNEHDLLEQMVALRCARLEQRTPEFDVYGIDDACALEQRST